MPTPYERMLAIVNARTPTVVKFKVNLHPNYARAATIALEGVTIKATECNSPTNDEDLFTLLKDYVHETWDADAEKYVISATVDSLWGTVRRAVSHQYENVSKRCAATKRKTTDFISKIKIDDKLLSEFILQTFIKTHSPSYKQVSLKDREALFEHFESLRRTFGKRV